MTQESFAGSVPGFYVVSFSYQRKCQLGKVGPVRKAAQEKSLINIEIIQNFILMAKIACALKCRQDV